MSITKLSVEYDRLAGLPLSRVMFNSRPFDGSKCREHEVQHPIPVRSASSPLDR